MSFKYSTILLDHVYNQYIVCQSSEDGLPLTVAKKARDSSMKYQIIHYIGGKWSRDETDDILAWVGS